MSEVRKQFSTRLWRFINLALLALVIGLAVACGGSLSSPSSTSVPATAVPAGTTLYTYRGHSSLVDAVAWSPDSKYIASGSDYPTTVQVWDASNGHLLLTYRGNSASTTAIAWSPDGKYIASGDSDDKVQVWDALTGTTRLTYKGHPSYVFTVAWSPDGKYIASGDAYSDIQV